MINSPSEAFVEQMGLIAQSEGLPRIAGRVLGLLIVEGRPFTLDEMTERLQVSKASVSTNSRLLEAKHAVRRTSRPGIRQDYFEAVPPPDSQFLTTIAQRFRRHAEALASIGVTFAEGEADRRARVTGYSDFFLSTADFLDGWGACLSSDSVSMRKQTR